jgi:phage gp36-like protein
MALPPFATTDDLDVRLPPGVVVDDERKEAALADASALIHALTNEAWVEDGALVATVPDVALTVCCKAAVRALVNPSGATQESTGPFSYTYGDVYLTSTERDLIRGAVSGGTGGVWTLGTTRLDTYEAGDLRLVNGDLWVDVNGQPNEPIPLMPASGPV